MVQRAYEPMNSGITLENGRYGRRAILNSAWLDYFVQYLADNAVVEFELNYAKGWHGQSLSFLAELPSLKAFEIFDFNIPDIKEIHRLHNLRRLGVTTYCSTEIDFSAFPELESCVLEWRPKAVSLFKCTTLKDVFVDRYKGKDVARFAQLVNLESLSILNAPVASLRGLSALTRLRSLRLASLRRLPSAFLCSQAVYPHMVKAGGGKIINVGSMLSIFGMPLAVSYGASKGGIVQMGRSLAAAWGKDNIQVNAILPGWIDTDLTGTARTQIEGLNERVMTPTPAKRWVSPDDFAGIAIFLTSAASDSATGTAIPIDGGYSIAG